MKKLWFRVGMTISFSKEDYERIIAGQIEAKDILSAIKEGRAVIDGETYSPHDEQIINISIPPSLVKKL